MEIAECFGSPGAEETRIDKMLAVPTARRWHRTCLWPAGGGCIGAVAT